MLKYLEEYWIQKFVSPDRPSFQLLRNSLNFLKSLKSPKSLNTSKIFWSHRSYWGQLKWSEVTEVFWNFFEIIKISRNHWWLVKYYVIIELFSIQWHFVKAFKYLDVSDVSRSYWNRLKSIKSSKVSHMSPDILWSHWSLLKYFKIAE